MESLNFGDIVLLKFPFTDSKTFKKRPALILFDSQDGDILVCRITSQFYSSDFDLEIKEWKTSGLKLPSVIRIHKLATLEKSMVENLMGKISDALRLEVFKKFQAILNDE